MENFRKSFISAATKYADYVGAKISNTAEIKELKPGNAVLIEENPLEAAKVLYEEMRTLNQTAEILGIESLAADPDVTRHFIVDEKSILFSTVSTPLRHLHFADRTLLSTKLCSQIKIFRLELCVQ